MEVKGKGKSLLTALLQRETKKIFVNLSPVALAVKIPVPL